MSHSPESWMTRSPSPAAVTCTCGSRTSLDAVCCGERAPPDIGDDGFPEREAYSNAAGTQRHDSRALAYNQPLAPVAQWIEQPPPKGQVGRSIRLWGATSSCVRLLRGLSEDEGVKFHARFVDPRHRWIGLEIALVENRVEHLRHKAAIGRGDLIAVAV